MLGLSQTMMRFIDDYTYDKFIEVQSDDTPVHKLYDILEFMFRQGIYYNIV